MDRPQGVYPLNKSIRLQERREQTGHKSNVDRLMVDETVTLGLEQERDRMVSFGRTPSGTKKLPSAFKLCGNVTTSTTPPSTDLLTNILSPFRLMVKNSCRIQDP